MMKRFLTAALAVILTLSLAACSDGNSAKLPSVSTGDTSVLGTDFQKAMNQSSSEWFSQICETSEGYYFQYDMMVYYIDKDTGESTALCGKPDCAHTYSESDRSCNALINARFLTYYNGKLYYSNADRVKENGSYVDYGERLFSMNLDGTEHNAIQSMNLTVGGNTSMFVTEPMIHRGYIYFCYSGALYAVALGDDIDNAVKIYGSEIIADGSNFINTNEMYYELWADGDVVYFMAKNVKQSNGTYKDTLFSYNPQTNKTEKVWEVPNKSEVGTWDTTGVSVSQWYVSNGYIYFFMCGNDIWYTELSTGKTNKLIDLDLDAGIAAFSSEYIAVINKEYSGFKSFTGESSVTGGDTLFVYNYAGKLVKEISLKDFYDDNENVTDCDLLWIGNGKVYIHVDATTVGGVNVSTGASTATVNRHSIITVDIESGAINKTGWNIGK